jgi:alpha-beta hydrolase superfamily lysophospholipase
MAAAVRLAMRHLNDRLDGKPLFIIGYSMGGALAVEYALEKIENNNLPAVEKIVLVSPAIGVTRLAALSVWQARMGRWLGLDKLAWNTIQPEYNSFKYSSFAINAGFQVHRLTTTIQKRLAAVRQSGELNRFPPVLTFQSIVDATVSTPAVFSGLYHQLINAGNELVIFDINRSTGIASLMSSDPLDRILALQTNHSANYGFTLVTNERAVSPCVDAVSGKNGTPDDRSRPLDLCWPDGVHSLSHIALPFPENDPLYGTADNALNPGIALSNTILRGEKGVIDIPADEILRLRWNPFYPYLSKRMVQFLGL